MTNRTILVDTLLYSPTFKVISTENDIATIKTYKGEIVERKIYKDNKGDNFFRLYNEKHWLKFLFEIIEETRVNYCEFQNCSNSHVTYQYDRKNLTTYHIMTDGTKVECYAIQGGVIK